MEKLDLEI
jgi:chromosome segregation ATPase